MDIDFDPKKNAANIRKHRISFAQAREMWDQPHVIIPAKNIEGENRYAILGKIESKIYMAIFTLRDEGVRLISCHRADKKWERIYENHIKKIEA